MGTPILMETTALVGMLWTIFNWASPLLKFWKKYHCFQDSKIKNLEGA